MASVHGLVVGLLLLGLSGCSIQKRTTLPGWHWEHEKTAIRSGPMPNAEAFVKDRGHLVNLAPRGTCCGRRVTSAGHCMFQANLLAKLDVEAMPTLVVSELDEANRPSTLMLFWLILTRVCKVGRSRKSPTNGWSRP